MDWERKHWECVEVPCWMRPEKYGECFNLFEEQQYERAAEVLSGGCEGELFVQDLDGIVFADSLALPLTVESGPLLARVAPHVPYDHQVSQKLEQLLLTNSLGAVFQIQLIHLSGDPMTGFVNPIWVTERFSQLDFFAALVGLQQSSPKFNPLRFRYIYNDQEWAKPKTQLSRILRAGGRSRACNDEIIILTAVARQEEVSAVLEKYCLLPFQAYPATRIRWDIPIEEMDMEVGDSLQPPEDVQLHIQDTSMMATLCNYRCIDLRNTPHSVRSDENFYKWCDLGLHECLGLIQRTPLDNVAFLAQFMDHRVVMRESMQLREEYGHEMFLLLRLLLVKPHYLNFVTGTVPLPAFSIALGSNPPMHLSTIFKYESHDRADVRHWEEYVKEFFWMVRNSRKVSEELPTWVRAVALDHAQRHDAEEMDDSGPADPDGNGYDVIVNRSVTLIRRAIAARGEPSIPSGAAEGVLGRCWRRYRPCQDNREWLLINIASAMGNHMRATEHEFEEFGETPQTIYCSEGAL